MRHAGLDHRSAILGATFAWALTSTTMSLTELNEYAETILAQRISTVDGVSQVNVYGSQKYAVRVRLDPRALAARVGAACRCQDQEGKR